MRRGQQMNFLAAVANWRRWHKASDSTGWPEMCGSAERMYAHSAERIRGHDSPEIEVPVDSRAADRMERLVRHLPQTERDAWLVWVGVRPRADGTTEEWLREWAERARTRLIVGWVGPAH